VLKRFAETNICTCHPRHAKLFGVDPIIAQALFTSPPLLDKGELMNERLQSALRKLRLSGLIQSLDVRLQEPAGHGLTHAEVLG
jgi:hypothetical protein